MRLILVALAIACAPMLNVTPAAAQSSPSETEKATVLFDLRLDKMRDGELSKSLEIGDEEMEAFRAGMGGDLDLTKVNRVFGLVSLPNSVQELMAVQNPTAPLPLDFFVQIKFADAESAQKAYDAAAADSEQVERNGVTFLRPPNSPTNLVAKMYDETTMEIGTENYLTQESRGKEIFSSGLSTGWSKVPDHGLRIVMDLAGEAQLISEAMQLAQAQAGGDPMATAFIGLLDNAKDLRISFDPDSDLLLELGATGVDEEKAKELQSGLASMLGIAKASAGMATQQIPDEQARAMVATIMNSLEAKQDGVDVRISIPRPEGFSEFMKGALQQVKDMMMMGAPGGGF